MKNIICKNGMGREVNPFNEFSAEASANQWHKFEKTIQSYPCFSTTGESVENYQGEAELVWQTKAKQSSQWLTVSSEKLGEIKSLYPFHDWCQVWIVPSPHAPLLNQSASKEPLEVGEEKPIRQKQTIQLTNGKFCYLEYPSKINLTDIKILKKFIEILKETVALKNK